MNPNEVIESYVADVIRRVPIKERNDIGVELHTLLSEMLEERAQAAGQAETLEVEREAVAEIHCGGGAEAFSKETA